MAFFQLQKIVMVWNQKSQNSRVQGRGRLAAGLVRHHPCLGAHEVAPRPAVARAWLAAGGGQGHS
jgi:hypothetical protein